MASTSIKLGQSDVVKIHQTHWCPENNGISIVSHNPGPVSVVDTEWSSNFYHETYNQTWPCPDCGMALCLSPLERIQHKQFTCSSRIEKAPEAPKPVKDNRPNAKEYKCESCEKTLSLTPVEILKHKKSCKMK